jgi:hypothetical protein
MGTTVQGQVAKIVPITAFGQTAEGLRATFQLPCAARFLGIAATRVGENIELGAVYVAAFLRCANVPKPESVALPWLDSALATRVRPLSKIRQKGTWRMTSGLVIENTSGGEQSFLDFVYPSTCGRSTLPVFQVDNSSIITIAALEYSTASGTEECPTIEKQIHLGKFVTKKVRTSLKFQSYFRPVKDLNRAYFVTLAKVVDSAIQRQAGQGVSVAFKRRCNEVAIGLVMSPVKVSDGLRSAEVGVLLGHYYNAPCPTGSRSDYVTERLRVPALEFSGDVMLTALDSRRYGQQLRVRSPAVSGLTVYGQNVGIVLDYISDCSQQIGAVYHFSAGEPLAVGVLEDLSNAKCIAEPKRISLLQPFMDRNDPRIQAPIYPLRLPGLTEF